MISFLLTSLLILVNSKTICALQNTPDLWKRSKFLQNTVAKSLSFVIVPQVAGAAGAAAVDVEPSQKTQQKQKTIMFPLRYLPLAGCLALPITLNDGFTYYGVVDTGSPFLTAPQSSLQRTKDASKRYPTTYEQYGEATGGMSWRSTSSISIRNIENEKTKFKNGGGGIILGVPASNVIDDTGGIFVGLMAHDDLRPTVLKQLGYTSFSLNYPERTLKLSKSNLISADEETNNNALDLFDFSPYGPNLHHYGVVCESFTLYKMGNKKSPLHITCSSLKRPVICVLDSGLTGCIFSDSLRDELFSSTKQLNDITGAEVHLQTSGSSRKAETKPSSTVVLQSDTNHWFLSSFKLPWFDNDDTHPHVIALGATFLATSTLTVDPLSARAMLEFDR